MLGRWVHSPNVHVFLNYISIVCLGDEEVKTCSVLFLLSLYVSMYLAFSVSLQLHVQSCMVWIWVMRKSRQVEQRGPTRNLGDAYICDYDHDPGNR